MSGCNFVEADHKDTGIKIAKIFSRNLSGEIKLEKAQDANLTLETSNLKLEFVKGSFHNAKIDISGVMTIDKPPYDVEAEFNAVINSRLVYNDSVKVISIEDSHLESLVIPKMHDEIRGEVILSAPETINEMLKANINGRLVFDLSQHMVDAGIDPATRFSLSIKEKPVLMGGSIESTVMALNIIKNN
jgi:hypothetical protein